MNPRTARVAVVEDEPEDDIEDAERIDRLDLTYIFYVVRRWLLLIVTGVLFIVGATIALFRLTPPEYEATTVLLFDQPQQVAPGSGGLSAAQKLLELMPTYAEVAVSDLVLRDVQQALQTDESLSTIRSRVSAIPVEDTLTIRITGRDASARTAEELSQTTANGLRDQVAALQDRGSVPPEGRYIITTIGSPVAARPSRNEARTVVLAGLLGAAVMAGVAFLLEYMAREE